MTNQTLAVTATLDLGVRRREPARELRVRHRALLPRRRRFGHEQRRAPQRRRAPVLDRGAAVRGLLSRGRRGRNPSGRAPGHHGLGPQLGPDRLAQALDDGLAVRAAPPRRRACGPAPGTSVAAPASAGRGRAPRRRARRRRPGRRSSSSPPGAAHGRQHRARGVLVGHDHRDVLAQRRELRAAAAPVGGLARAARTSRSTSSSMHDDGIVEAVARGAVSGCSSPTKPSAALARHLHEARAARVQERVAAGAGIATTRQVTPTAPRIDSSTPLPRKNEAGSPARAPGGAAQAAAHARRRTSTARAAAAGPRRGGRCARSRRARGRRGPRRRCAPAPRAGSAGAACADASGPARAGCARASIVAARVVRRRGRAGRACPPARRTSVWASVRPGAAGRRRRPRRRTRWAAVRPPPRARPRAARARARGRRCARSPRSRRSRA